MNLDKVKILEPEDKPIEGRGKWLRLVDRIEHKGSVILPCMNQAISLQRAARIEGFKSSRMFTMTGDYRVWVYKEKVKK